LPSSIYYWLVINVAEKTQILHSIEDKCLFLVYILVWLPIPAATLSKLWVCGRSFAGIVG